MDAIDAKMLYSVEDAAKHLGVKPDTVKAYLRDGRLTGLQVGPKKQWKVHGAALLKKLKEWNLTN